MGGGGVKLNGGGKLKLGVKRGCKTEKGRGN